jgi:hypothetical protein
VARVEPETLADRELAKVFVAFTMAEAQRAEQVLTAGGVQYVVAVEAVGRTLFGSSRSGAIFSVVAEQAEYCGSLLRAAGMDFGTLTDEPPPGRSADR